MSLRCAARTCLIAILLSAGACTQVTPPDRATLGPAQYGDLPGWSGDNPAGALTAFVRSCKVLTALPPQTPLGPGAIAGQAGSWRGVCRDARRIEDQGADDNAARRFFRRRFRPFLVSGPEGSTGLFTGYFEISLRGAWRRSQRFQVPLYRRPPDLVSVDLGAFRRSLRGKSIAGRVENGRLVPYADRGAIDNGALARKGLELLWLDDPVDAFFLHVQGSGRVEMTDGSVLRVGFAGKNGHAYSSIGRALIEMGEMERGAVTMQSIRAWLAANPAKARRLLARNRSYIFFRPIRGAGPIGSQGVPLTADRSIAVDRAFLPLGVPLFVAADDPAGKLPPVRRLMIAQDTGSAIRGAVRGDMFLGHGETAADAAGRTRMRGRYWILLPATLAERQRAGR